MRGDVDGFFGLAVDNLVQLLLIAGLCEGVLGFSPELLYGQVLPAVALSLVVGNAYYSYQAVQVARKESRDDVCALPYGINTVSLFAFVFLVMLPAKLAAQAAGAPNPEVVAWQTGLWACFGSGLVELLGAFVAEPLRKVTPRAALLSTLAGIALTFISLGFLFRTFAHPLVGLSTLAVVLLVYFGRVTFKGGVPGGLVAVCIGLVLSWSVGLAPVGEMPVSSISFHVPFPAVGALLAGAQSQQSLTALAVILPMGLFNLIGSLQNIESAEAAGDRFATAPSLAVNGAGTLVAALFGSCFPTTIYIGHPGWKTMGARAGYSLLNGAFFLVVLLTGSLAYLRWAIPVDAGMAIVLWIGVVITSQAFQATPGRHAPAVVMGLLPGVAAWGTLMAKNGLRAAGMGTESGSFGPDLARAFASSDTWIEGAFALEQGFLLTAMIFAAATASLIDRQFFRAGVWSLAGAAFSAVGVMHSFQYTPTDTALSLTPNVPFVLAYLVMGAVFFAAPFVTREKKEESAGEKKDAGGDS